jgi:hypothetical protein
MSAATCAAISVAALVPRSARRDQCIGTGTTASHRQPASVSR